jgi:acetolactate decarboxylase
MKKPNNLFLVLLISILLTSCCSALYNERDVLYQVSTYHSLLEGDYDGTVTYGELKKYGDLGLGTFDGLDGEMVIVDGIFYQISGDGSVHDVRDTMPAPFAAVTFFEPDKTVTIKRNMTRQEIEQYIYNLFPEKDSILAIRIDGEFTYLKTRSVNKQQKPYPPIENIIKNQPEFEFHNIKGTMAGFRFPDYMKAVNAPGYHFHFINNARNAGGHVLEYEIKNAKIEIDFTPDLFIALPEHKGIQ